MDPQITPDMEQAPQDAPVQMPVPKAKSNTPLIIILAILALAGLGFGAYGMFLMPPKTVEKVVEKEVSSEHDNEVKDVVNKIINVVSNIDGARFVTRTYDDNVPYKAENMKAYTNLEKSYGVTTRNESLLDMSKSIVATLMKDGFKKYDFENFFGDTEYINEETGIICALSVASDPYSASCGHISWLSEEKIALINQLVDAGADSIEINASVEDIVDSTKTPYQRITVSGSNHAMLFYRTSPDSEWKFFKGTQDLIACSEYNTDDLKNAFFGESCWDEKASQASTVSL